MSSSGGITVFKNIFCAFALMLVTLLPAASWAGGRPIPMMEVIDAPVAWVGGAPSDAALVQRAIMSALLAKAWQPRLVSPGLIHAVLSHGDWTAEIDVTYDERQYSIRYSASEHLDYDPVRKVIHRNFNKWLATLRYLIDIETARTPAPAK
jgi:hypothetical protein